MKPTPWQDMEFRHLDYAIAVKRHQGFMQAAIALGIDQGFLSKQIQRLETRLGFTLFDRTHRPLSVTEAGKSFLIKAEQIIEQTEKAVERSQDIQAGKQGRLEVGINTSISNSRLSDIIQAFHQQFPKVNLVLHELASYHQIEQLRNRQIDVGFFHKHTLHNLTDEERTMFATIPILHEPLVVVLPQHHRLAKQAKISLAQLSGDRFVLPPHTQMYGLRDQIDQLCLKANCKPNVVQEAAWITTVLSLVAGGLGVSLLPANVNYLQRAGVVYRDIQETSPLLEIVAVRYINHTSILLENFLNTLTDC